MATGKTLPLLDFKVEYGHFATAQSVNRWSKQVETGKAMKAVGLLEHSSKGIYLMSNTSELDLRTKLQLPLSKLAHMCGTTRTKRSTDFAH